MSNKKLIKEIILERNPEALFLGDQFDKALMGSAIPCGQKHVAIYDSDKCIKILMDGSDVGELEALEQFQLTSELSTASKNKPILFSNFSDIKEVKISNLDEKSTLKDII